MIFKKKIMKIVINAIIIISANDGNNCIFEEVNQF